MKKKTQRNNEYLLHFRTNGIIALQLEAIHANPFSNLSFLGNESLEPNRNAFESRLVSHILFISCISFGFNIFVQSYLSLDMVDGAAPLGSLSRHQFPIYSDSHCLCLYLIHFIVR